MHVSISLCVCVYVCAFACMYVCVLAPIAGFVEVETPTLFRATPEVGVRGHNNLYDGNNTISMQCCSVVH